MTYSHARKLSCLGLESAQSTLDTSPHSELDLAVILGRDSRGNVNMKEIQMSRKWNCRSQSRSNNNLIAITAADQHENCFHGSIL
jgi:hypothetical protein